MNNGKVVRSVLFATLFLTIFAMVACSSDDDSITDIEWQWESVTDRPTSETTTVPDPENYTLIFRDDDTFSGQADCNQIAGTYSQEAGFSLTLGPSTMAFCGDDSLDQLYLELLGGVAAGGPDGSGGFALEWAGAEKRMEFSDGGKA